jgi:endogenous inhibitor of DNA gyrase (YacG/DUF329 family)
VTVRTFACPTCKAPVTKGATQGATNGTNGTGQDKLFPFCSERCHLVDLGRWLGEEFRIPAEPADGVMPQGHDDDAQ